MDAETAAILDELARGLDAAARAVDRLAARYRKGRAPAPEPEPDRSVKQRHEWPSAWPRGEARPGEPVLERKPAAAAKAGASRGGRPGSGKALFAWVKDREQEQGPGLLKHLNGWAKRQGFPGRMVEWDPAQLKAGYDEAARQIAASYDANGNGA